MSIEATNYINGLNPANPSPSDGIGEAFRHIQLIKAALKATFPGIDSAVTLTNVELNRVYSDLDALEKKILLAKTKLHTLETSTPNNQEAIDYAKTVAQVRLLSGIVLLMKDGTQAPPSFVALNPSTHQFLNPPAGAQTSAQIQQLAAVVKG